MDLQFISEQEEQPGVVLSGSPPDPATIWQWDDGSFLQWDNGTYVELD